MKKYAVKQLAKLSGVTVRTLHHYDKIGLLKPAIRTEKNYRYYGRTELLRLQQILFYKELGFPLEQIAEILENPAFDLIEALESHKLALVEQADRIRELLRTLDKTIVNLKNEGEMKDEEMYEGLKPEEREARRRQVAEKWGKESLEKGEERVRQMGKQGLAEAKAEGEAINKRLAGLMQLDPTDPKVQEVIAHHYEHLQRFTPINKERYLGLAKMYNEDERFKAHYEQHGEGLAAFLQKGIQVFCDHGLQAT